MVCRALVATMLIMSATGCYQSVCADPICWDSPADSGETPADGQIADAGIDTLDAAPEIADAAAEAPPHPDCQTAPPTVIPPGPYFAAASYYSGQRMRTVSMAGTCNPLISALANFEPGADDPVEANLYSLTLMREPGTSIQGDAVPRYRGKQVAPAPYGFAAFTDEVGLGRWTLATFDVNGEKLADSTLNSSGANPPALAETLGNPSYAIISTLNSGTNQLTTFDITSTTTPDFPTTRHHAFTMPENFVLGEVVGNGVWFAMKLGYIKDSVAIGEIVFTLLSSGEERHFRFAEQRFYADQNGVAILDDLIFRQSDIAPHPQGVLVTTNGETGGIAYILQTNGAKQFITPMNGLGTAIARLPFGFAAASYQGGLVHVTIRNIVDDTTQVVTVNAPHEIIDSPRMAAAYHGYVIGVSMTYLDLPSNVSATRFHMIVANNSDF